MSMQHVRFVDVVVAVYDEVDSTRLRPVAASQLAIEVVARLLERTGGLDTSHRAASRADQAAWALQRRTRKSPFRAMGAHHQRQKQQRRSRANVTNLDP